MNLENESDNKVIQEAVVRLIQEVKRKLGVSITYGNFIFTVHDGFCTKVDFNINERCFNRKSISSQGGSCG